MEWLRENPGDYLLVRNLFLRLVALVYGIAFLSLWVQIDGLIGSNGIMPSADFLVAAHQNLGSDAYHRLPTLLWINSSDAAMHVVCMVGMVASILAILGVASAVCTALLWVCYLSLFSVSGDFLAFQWDILLLETGFLAILWAPIRRFGGLSIFVLWLIRWLMFRLMFSSGMVKLLSGDPSWRDLSALVYHYETQPLPTWIGWYVHQLPELMLNISVVGMLAIELVVPFLILAPRIPRLSCCGIMALLQLGIAVTGNYGFFNLLTLALCIPLLDDHLLRRLRCAIVSVYFAAGLPDPDLVPKQTAYPGRKHRWLLNSIAGLLVLLSTFQISHTLRWNWPWPDAVLRAYSLFQPFHLVGGYGLFAVMTKIRPEIQIEGSDDGREWKAFSFKWKAGEPGKPPGFVQPHMPRLDWVMWFAALRSYRDYNWFAPFLKRLLEGSPEVLGLMESGPFETPPRYIRARLFNYRFTDWEERSRTGDWWDRVFVREYSPPWSLRRLPRPDRASEE